MIFGSAPTQTASTGLAGPLCCRRYSWTTRGHRCRDVVGARDRRLDVQHQDGVIAGIRQQRLKRRCIARGVGVADDVYRI